MSIGGLKRFECIDASNENDVYSLHYEYDKVGKKMLFISGKGEKGGKETIVGKKYDVYEKQGQLLWKGRVDEGNSFDNFLDLKTMRLNLFYDRGGNEYKEIYECKKLND